MKPQTEMPRVGEATQPVGAVLHGLADLRWSLWEAGPEVVSVLQMTEQARGALPHHGAKPRGARSRAQPVGEWVSPEAWLLLGARQGRQGGVLPGQGCTGVPSGTSSRRTRRESHLNSTEALLCSWGAGRAPGVRSLGLRKQGPQQELSVPCVSSARAELRRPSRGQAGRGDGDAGQGHCSDTHPGLLKLKS